MQAFTQPGMCGGWTLPLKHLSWDHFREDLGWEYLCAGTTLGTSVSQDRASLTDLISQAPVRLFAFVTSEGGSALASLRPWIITHHRLSCFFNSNTSGGIDGFPRRFQDLCGKALTASGAFG